MSSPGASSGSPIQIRYQESATSSGRTTPDHHPNPSSSSGSGNQYNHSKSMPAAFSQHPPRRSSTPASSFLAPRFFGQSYPYDTTVAASSHASSTGRSEDSTGANAPPRRTSFATSLGGRLSALSSLGWGGAAWSQLPPTPGQQHHQPSSQMSSATASPILKPADRTDSVTAGEGGTKPRSAQQTEMRHICVPDGCGGFITIEQKSRRPSQA